jgi:hypothetical protein
LAQSPTSHLAGSMTKEVVASKVRSHVSQQSNNREGSDGWRDKERVEYFHLQQTTPHQSNLKRELNHEIYETLSKNIQYMEQDLNNGWKITNDRITVSETRLNNLSFCSTKKSRKETTWTVSEKATWTPSTS